VIKNNFGEPVLFLCYEFFSEFKRPPGDFVELFEYINYRKTKNILKEMAIKAAQIGTG
jgi:hypothetical protein